MTIGSTRAMLTSAVPAADRARLHAGLSCFAWAARRSQGLDRSVPALGLARLLGLLSDP
jgi:hypothetical protein